MHKSNRCDAQMGLLCCINKIRVLHGKYCYLYHWKRRLIINCLRLFTADFLVVALGRDTPVPFFTSYL